MTIKDLINDPTILSSKETVVTILEIIKRYLSEVEKYKKENNI